jgi:hypothetical protein
VHSGLWIHPNLFSGCFTLNEWLRSESLSDSEEKALVIRAKISRALSRLVDQGLIVETVADP